MHTTQMKESESESAHGEGVREWQWACPDGTGPSDPTLTFAVQLRHGGGNKTAATGAQHTPEHRRETRATIVMQSVPAKKGGQSGSGGKKTVDDAVILGTPKPPQPRPPRPPTARACLMQQ